MAGGHASGVEAERRDGHDVGAVQREQPMRGAHELDAL